MARTSLGIFTWGGGATGGAAGAALPAAGAAAGAAAAGGVFGKGGMFMVWMLRR